MHADPLIRQVLDVWMPRLLNGGVFYDDIRWTVARMRSWDDWGPEWVKTAELHEGLAAQALAAGRTFTAMQAFENAEAAYHTAYHIYIRDLDVHRHGLRKMVELHERVLPTMEPAVAKVRVLFEDTYFTALFSKPRGAERPPVVIMIPGLDSTKETRHRTRGAYLRRGMAVLTIDGPGQGETSLRLPIRPDYECAIAAAIDYLESRDDVDASRVGLNGMSLGGYYAPRAAAFEQRVSACVGNCGPYDFSESFERIPQVTREAFMHYSGARDMDDAYERSKALSLRGVAERITCPLLIMYGREDPLFAWEQGERIVAEASGPKQFVNFDEGNHALNNIPYKSGPLAADWLAEQLGGKLG